MSAIDAGQVIAEGQIPLSRADLVAYAAASGDHNPIHWNERFAREVGLDGVIAHGMLTMGAAIGVVTDVLSDPAAVLDYQTRFTSPVLVPDAETGSPAQPAQMLDVVATVASIDEAAGTARVDLTVAAAGTTVLGRARAIVRLDAIGAGSSS